MTREIKFRCWDSETKRMLNMEEFNLQMVLDYHPELLMQFTGLTDKNGTEIWEGDIVEDLIKPKIGVVKFNHGAFVLQFKQISNWKPVNRGGSANVKVIGNVYNNPDLLK